MRGMDDEDDVLLKTAEVAAMLRIDPATVSRYARAGLIERITLPGGGNRYRRSSVQAIIQPARDER